MADNIVDISILAPLQFTKEGFVNPLPYNTRYRDNWQYPDTFSSTFTIPPYYQPWQQNDILEFQILSNYAPHQIELYDCDDNQVAGGSFSLTYINTSIEATGSKCYQASISLNAFDEGIYRFKIFSGNPAIATYVSNFFELRAFHQDTVLLEVTHDQNDFDVVFETGIVIRLRVHGSVLRFQPGMDRVIYIDQSRNATQLSGNPFYIGTFVIGDAAGVPDYLIEIINDLTGCNKFLIDGKQFTANEGVRFEAQREELYALTGWAFELRETEAKTKRRFIADGLQGTPTSVVWNIEQKGFGPASSQASTNIIQIQELK